MLLIQAELRRLRTVETKSTWSNDLAIEDERLPIVPKLTDLFFTTVGETEWHLTDERLDDTSQQSLLHLL